MEIRSIIVGAFLLLGASIPYSWYIANVRLPRDDRPAVFILFGKSALVVSLLFFIIGTAMIGIATYSYYTWIAVPGFFLGLPLVVVPILWKFGAVPHKDEPTRFIVKAVGNSNDEH